MGFSLNFSIALQHISRAVGHSIELWKSLELNSFWKEEVQIWKGLNFWKQFQLLPRGRKVKQKYQEMGAQDSPTNSLCNLVLNFLLSLLAAFLFNTVDEVNVKIHHIHKKLDRIHQLFFLTVTRVPKIKILQMPETMKKVNEEVTKANSLRRSGAKEVRGQDLLSGRGLWLSCKPCV